METTTTKKTTFNPWTDLVNLMNYRNELVSLVACISRPRPRTLAELEEVNATICDRMSLLAVRKTLEFLQDNPVNISSNGLEVIDKMLRTFYLDFATLRTWNLTEIFGDTIPLYDLAYVTINEYLTKLVPLTITDTVYTTTLKNGKEKNYTLYQYAQKIIKEDIRAWNSTNGAELKKIRYLMGYTEDGKQITSTKRPLDELADITSKEKADFLKSYGLTAREQKILYLNKFERVSEEDIAILLNLSKVTVYQTIARAKAKFATANAYAELVTARNAEKRALADKENNAHLPYYAIRYEEAKARTEKALKVWRGEFYNKISKN